MSPDDRWRIFDMIEASEQALATTGTVWAHQHSFSADATVRSTRPVAC